ncbi:uncharacterized protein B0I36DRAFT_44938 [Microdochium trichocladiopsis]|uniref:Zn(2)-C6 fungal-type domain-containing protein n=1 Tax=Microdochium trichocladiopsis TaxID=1682393 RepID=A0A9P9BJS1_9PEZI|nr:uncharacterized protein B0I36DRAFT_44938 [Microdochium trichocladiopsis]KAH7016299.1 hypothetical protein B0I36DRAFT_44938 [Microdochium trichocladiopsis]
MVKRDPNEEALLSQLRRPNSMGHPIDSQPPTPHAPHHRPVHPPPEPSRQMSYDNGQSMAQSPTTSGPPPPPYPGTGTPLLYHIPYDGSPYGHGGHPSHAPPPMTYHTPLEIAQAASTKRKATRTSQACDSCRLLKSKCDGSKPCKTCIERNIPCVFRDPQPRQSDKANADILDALNGLRDDLMQRFGKIDNRLGRLEGAIHANHQNGAPDLKMESIDVEDYQEDAGPHDHPSPDDRGAEDEYAAKNGVMDPDKAEKTIRIWDHNDSDEKPGPPVAGKTKLPANHTTSAGLLLKWKSIHRLVAPHLAAEHIGYVEEFPIRQEKARGLLRVCGAGEGSGGEHAPADHTDQPADNIMTDFQDDSSEAQSPAPNSEVWGQTGGLSPAQGMTFRGGVIGTDGNPDFSHSTVWKYVTSFKDNILNMHPIMILEELDALVVLFLKEIPQHTQQSSVRSSSNPKFVGQPTAAAPSLPEAVGAKRKRSLGGDDPAPSVNILKPAHPSRSIASAIVLLVCALGKIRLHKQRIPDIVREQGEAQRHRSPSMRNGGAMSPIHGSPLGFDSHSQSSGLPSPQEPPDGAMPKRRASMQGHGTGVRPTPIKRNYDVIPGLEYFALATDILGSHLGGIDLKHVYAWVLAGLYYGQLARAVESWAYIKQGCIVLQEVMRTSIYRFHEIKMGDGYVPQESRRDNLVLLAYWTCLQLESDILAELPLSQSPILQHEDNMPYPNTTFVTAHGYNPEVCGSYFAQLHLRRQLNEIHSHLYNPDKIHRPSSPETIDEGIHGLQTQLKTSRDIWVPAAFRWHDDEPPAGDILSARLRAKYWGSQVIIYRPFVRHLLEKEPIPYGAYEDPRLPPPEMFHELAINIGDKPVPEGVDPRTLNYARLGIEALVQSTSAFHGMPRKQRIIVTNIFGTAHAQWGNLLTLAACYTDPLLTRFVDSEVLSGLFRRTIEFFDVIAHRSSPLRSEPNILFGLASDLRLLREDPQTSSSFSSMTSSTTPVATSAASHPPTSHPGDMYPPTGSSIFACHHAHSSRP